MPGALGILLRGGRRCPLWSYNQNVGLSFLKRAAPASGAEVG